MLRATHSAWILPSAGVAADAAELDINDARGVEVESGLRITRVANGFVEANRSAIVSGAWRLKDVIHQRGCSIISKLNSSKRFRCLDIGQRVAEICINGQGISGCECGRRAPNRDPGRA